MKKKQRLFAKKGEIHHWKEMDCKRSKTPLKIEKDDRSYWHPAAAKVGWRSAFTEFHRTVLIP